LIELANPKIKDIREELKKYGDEPIRSYNQTIDEKIKEKKEMLGRRAIKKSIFPSVMKKQI